MNKYFNLVKEMELSKGIKVKCCVEIVLTIVLRLFTFYPFLLLSYLFTGLKKAFEFLDNLFYGIASSSKEKIYITILNNKEFEQVKTQLKELTRQAHLRKRSKSHQLQHPELNMLQT